MENVRDIEITDAHVSWINEGKRFDIKFERKVFQAVYISAKQEFVVIADNRETRQNNLFMYDAYGKIIANPLMPALTTKVDGVYSMWYVERKR